MWTSADKKPNWVKRRKVEPTPKRDPLWTYVTQTARVPNALTLHPSYIYTYIKQNETRKKETLMLCYFL